MATARGSRRSVTSTSVHGLILVPTRELAIQVSKECVLVCKVANKYLTKCFAALPDVDDADVVSMRMESIPIYGGVDIESQVSSLLGGGTTDESSSSSSRLLSLVVAATPGRLLDILRRGGGSDDIDDTKDSPAASSAFGDLRAIVFDEADRMACNPDMTSQVDDIVSILGSVRRQAREGKNADDDDGGGGDVLSCLVSATLPERARGVCDKWVPRSRVVVTVDSVATTTTETASANNRPACETHAGEEDGEGPTEASSSPEGDTALKNPDLSSYIPSNIVQTLHVCSNHKKPRKLILTLQKIYAARKDEGKGGGRFSANNRLTIVFFAQIKTVKYVSQLLVKEGLRCVELYGSLHQAEREKRLLEFKSGKCLFVVFVVLARYLFRITPENISLGGLSFIYDMYGTRQNTDSSRD